VLGCYDATTSTITMIAGWNWYAGADPTRIGPDQYDFQTTVTHELGHALGLGGSADPSSPMFETLAAGMTHRTMTTQDLNIPDPPAGADPLTATGFPVVLAPASVTPARAMLPTATATMTIAVSVPPSIVLAPQFVAGLVPVTSAAPQATAMAASATLSVRALPVQALSDPAGDSDRGSSLVIDSDTDQAPARDVCAAPEDLKRGRRPAPVEASKLVTGTRSLLRTWDDAISTYVAECDELAWPTAASPEPAIVAEPPTSALESTLIAGLAVAIWSSSEVRSRTGERRFARSYLKHGSPSH
jgi:hypothetical protein